MVIGNGVAISAHKNLKSFALASSNCFIIPQNTGSLKMTATRNIVRLFK